MARLGRAQPFSPHVRRFQLGAASCVLSGTITAATTEADIVTGGKTIILTLAGDSWVAAGGTFDGQRQNIIDNLTSAQVEATGWNAVVRALQGVAGVVRTSNAVVTITLDAQATYNTTATETITVTVPATALLLGVQLSATPTFAVTSGAAVIGPLIGFSHLGGGGALLRGRLAA